MDEGGSRLQLLLAELRRRKVFRVAVVYAAVAFVIWQIAEIAVPGLNLPSWVLTLVILLTALGFPIAVGLAWAFDITPEGVKRTEPEGTAVERLAVPTVEVAAERKSIVVLPFDNMSPDPADAYLSDGLTEEIITGLSCCGPLRVISRNSARALKGTQKDTRTIARELDVQYVLEGSVRKAKRWRKPRPSRRTCRKALSARCRMKRPGSRHHRATISRSKSTTRWATAMTTLSRPWSRRWFGQERARSRRRPMNEDGRAWIGTASGSSISLRRLRFPVTGARPSPISPFFRTLEDDPEYVELLHVMGLRP
jgi:hypothetical protein